MRCPFSKHRCKRPTTDRVINESRLIFGRHIFTLPFRPILDSAFFNAFFTWIIPGITLRHVIHFRNTGACRQIGHHRNRFWHLEADLNTPDGSKDHFRLIKIPSWKVGKRSNFALKVAGSNPGNVTFLSPRVRIPANPVFWYSERAR